MKCNPMCLNCMWEINPVKGKEDIAKIFDFSVPELGFTAEQLKSIKGAQTGNFVHTHNNKRIELDFTQIREIIEHALVVIATGVDTQLDIWAIQWPNDYKVKTL